MCSICRTTVEQNIEVGRQRKGYSQRSKEYWAVYVGYRHDAFLGQIEGLVKQLFPKEFDRHQISITDIIFKIHENNPTVFFREHDNMFTHKRKFRKLVRRAIAKARVAQ